ncbi:MAG: hypothetical protein QOK08_2668 [Actinomycetota bacterium]|nr:hypothetical protein [Actinomycetota bacterium]
MTTQQLGMKHRIAAQTLIEKIVAEYEARPPRSRLARVFGVPPIPTDDWSWHIGALGERIVSSELDGLPDGWCRFHSIPIGDSDADIDHVIVGPPGIFVINTKHHAGKRIWVAGKTLMVEGRRERHISLSIAEAERLTKILQARLYGVPHAQGVIALVNPKRITIKEGPHGVVVVDARKLKSWLTKLPPAMDAGIVDRVASVLNDPATWRPTALVDVADLSARFDALMATLRRAQAVHAVWILILGLAIFGACCEFFSHALQVG